jgi:hypothetical protein
LGKRTPEPSTGTTATSVEPAALVS